MLWNEYTATLRAADQRWLVVALGAGMREARKASEVATSNGVVEAARQHVATAISHLQDVQRLLGP